MHDLSSQAPVFFFKALGIDFQELLEVITLKLGHIAHYDLAAYREVYRDLREFFHKLQTSEYSNDPEHNLKEANRQENDGDFTRWYGEDNQKNTAWVMREIVRIAREHEKEVVEYFGEKQKKQELEQAAGLAGKYGYSLVNDNVK